MPEVRAKHGNVKAVIYEGGAHHLHEDDPVTGFKHLSSDEYLQNMGYPRTPAAYARNAVPATHENAHPPLVGGQVEPPAGPLPAEAPAAAEAVDLTPLQQQLEQLTQQL